MFLGGGVEVCYLTFGVAFFLTLFPDLVLAEKTLPDLKKRLLLFFSFTLIFFGLSAIQLIPFLELSHQSVRSAGLSYLEAGTWSLHPYDLSEFFLPDQYGLATDIKKYWSYQNWLKTIYMGGLPFILAAFFLKKGDRRVLGFLFLFIISLGFAMGKYTLFHPYLYEYLPFFNKLRFPVKFIFLGVLILSVAAGLGFDYLKKEFAEKTPASQRTAKRVLTLGFFCMAVFGFVDVYNQPLVTYFKEIGWDYPKYNEVEINLFNFKRFLAFVGLFCLGLYSFSISRFNKRFILAAIIALFVLDLFFANFNFSLKGNFETLQKESENAKFLKSDPELFRIFVTPKTRTANVKFKENWSGLNVLKEKLIVGLLGNQRILDTDGIAVTNQGRWKKLMGIIKTAPALDSTNLLNMMNVKYVVATEPLAPANFELVHSYDPIPDDPEERKDFENSSVIKVYKNKNFLPHALLLSQCRVLKSDIEFKEVLQSKIFNPEKVLLLDTEPSDFLCAREAARPNQGTVMIDSYESNNVELSIQTEERQLLFLSDSFYPGWKAYVDGMEKEIYRANYMFRAIVMEPGDHKVRFVYDPLSFKLGLAITLLTIVVCAIYFFKFRRITVRTATDI